MDLAKFFASSNALEWTAFLAAVGLIVVLGSILPRERRRRLLGPVVLLLLCVLLALAETVMASRPRAARTLGLLASFLLGLALIRLVFAVFFDAIPLTRRRFPRILQDVLMGVAYFVALMALFSASGVELSSILTTSALVTAVVAFALQDTLGNVIGGLAIQIMRPFAVGDWVTVESHTGRVTEINWRATRLVSSEEVAVIVPNGSIAKNVILNYSRPTNVVRREFKVSVAYDVPPSRVKEVAVRAIGTSPGILPEPAPHCFLQTFGDSGVEYACRFFIDDFPRRDVLVGEAAARVYYEFLREGVVIPYPIRTLHMYQHGDEQKRRAEEDRVRVLVDRFLAVDFLAPLGHEALLDLARRVRTVSFGQGEAIVREGEEGTDLFLIERGEVSVSVASGTGTHEVARLKAGDFFGEMSLMTGEARRATVVALGDVRAVRVDKESFRDVLAHDPELAERISHVLAQRETVLEERLASLPAEAEKVIEKRSAALLGAIKGFFGL
jgi:small-conductance mechanosensitive channel/CRP-like cAMP-binding protein